jgi:hypothetical protein
MKLGELHPRSPSESPQKEIIRWDQLESSLHKVAQEEKQREEEVEEKQEEISSRSDTEEESGTILFITSSFY